MAGSQHILVTGGAGFVGSHLVERLLNDGHRVTCLDNFYTGTKANVAAFAAHKNFALVQHDVCDPFDGTFDAIYHLACPASPVHYQRDPVQTMKTSWLGALNMLELARRNNAPILFTSTSEVYGDPLVHPQPESYHGNVNPIGIRACYDEGKRAAETLFFDYHRQHGVRIKVARLFNTYGPRMQPDDGRVVSNFLVQALRGESLTVYGDGAQTRSFCYVADLVEALVRFMATEDAVTGPINLGNPGEFTIRELAEKVTALVGNAGLSFHAIPADDPKQRKPDIARAKELLGWEPKITLDEGLKPTAEYFRALVGPAA